MIAYCFEIMECVVVVFGKSKQHVSKTTYPRLCVNIYHLPLNEDVFSRTNFTSSSGSFLLFTFVSSTFSSTTSSSSFVSMIEETLSLEGDNEASLFPTTSELMVMVITTKAVCVILNARYFGVFS